MTTYMFLQVLILISFSFIPVWAGGQAMVCFNQGHLFKSVVCVVIATLINVSYIVLGMAWVRYDWSFVTILSRMVL